MKNPILVVVGILVALGLGVGGAYLVTRSFSVADLDRSSLPGNQLPGFEQKWNLPENPRPRVMGPGMMDRFNRGQGGIGSAGPGRMGNLWFDESNLDVERISIDDARKKADAYIAGFASNLRVAEIMEFTNNFYVVVEESDTGKGAFELLITPVTGRVGMEPGPNRMWNLKYGHMTSSSQEVVNALTMEQAAAIAQEALDEKVPGAEGSGAGIEFYGYYSFDYEMDGEVAGMLSVNSETGRVWFHTWHGDFITEVEIME